MFRRFDVNDFNLYTRNVFVQYMVIALVDVLEVGILEECLFQGVLNFTHDLAL